MLFLYRSIPGRTEGDLPPSVKPLSELPSLEPVACSTVVGHRPHRSTRSAGRMCGNQNIVRRSSQTGHEIDAELPVCPVNGFTIRKCPLFHSLGHLLLLFSMAKTLTWPPGEGMGHF